MSVPLTAGELREYRFMRCRYLRYGRRGLRGVEDRYASLNRRVRNAIGKLPDGEREIAQMFYVDGLSCLAISLRVYYSERHIRRFKNHARDDIVTA